MVNKDKKGGKSAKHFEEPEPGFWQIIIRGVKKPVALMLVETTKFVVLLGCLIIINWFIKGLGAVGYSEERLQMFELIHFYGSIVASVVFVMDLLYKLFFA
jgi:hypothetical protein